MFGFGRSRFVDVELGLAIGAFVVTEVQRDLFVSGLMDGGGAIAQRPVVVDVPKEKGHVVLFGNNPMYRGETVGSYFMVFNVLLNFDNLNAGRKLDAR